LVPDITLFFFEGSTRYQMRLQNFFKPKIGVPVLRRKNNFFGFSTGTPFLGLKKFSKILDLHLVPGSTFEKDKKNKVVPGTKYGVSRYI
jgi:hypothetical protein